MRGRPRNRPPPGRILWSTVEIGEVMGWHTHRIRRWLIRENACSKHGRYWYASKAQLMRVFREAAHEIIANLPE